MGTSLAPALWGIPVVQSTTDRAQQFPTPSVNQRVQNLGTGAIERWSGATWATDLLLGASTGFTNLLDPAFGAKGDGTTDDTVAIKSALTAGGVIIIPPKRKFVITDSLPITGNGVALIIIGGGPNSGFINRAPAGKPTFLVTGATYWDLRDFGIFGDIAFPNDGLFMQQDVSANRPCFYRIRNLFLCPNGNGIHIQDSNTGTIEHCQYWPSGFNGGATATPANLKNAILADGTTTVNDLTIRKLNAVGYTTIANGGAAIRFNAVAGCGNIVIDECEIEGASPTTHRSMDLNNITAGLTVRANFVENSEVKINNCTNVGIENPDGGSDSIYTITNCDQVDVRNTNGQSFSADSSNGVVSVAQSTFSGAAGYVNGAQFPYAHGVRTTGSVLVADRHAGFNYAYATLVTNQTIGTGGRTTILCNANIADPFSQYTSGTGTFTAKYAGTYRVAFVATLAGSTAGKLFQFELYKNGSLLPVYGSAAGTGGQMGGSVEAIVTLAVGDTILAKIFSSDTVTQTLNPASLSLVQIS